MTGSKTRARTFFLVALLARFWISFWDSFGPPMPRRAFIFCWRFILLAAWATALRVGLPFLEAVFAAPRTVFFAGFFAFFFASFCRITTSSSRDMSTFFSTSVMVARSLLLSGR